MRTVKELLYDADPVHHEPGVSSEARERVRRAVLSADVRPSSPAFDVRGRRVLGAGVAALVVTAVVFGYSLWTRGATPAFAAVRFEVRLAEDAPAPGLREAPVGHEARIVYLHEDVVVTNDDIAASRVVPGRDATQFGVEVRFTPAGAAKMRAATFAHTGRPVALLIDGLVAMAPTLRSPIADFALLTGDYTAGEAERIVRGISMR